MPDVTIRRASDKLRSAVQKEVTQRRTLFNERDTVMHNIRRYRLMRHKPFMPKAYQRKLGGDNAVKLPVMYRLVQTAVSAVAKRFPTVYAEALSISDRKAASEFTRALQLLLQAMDRRAQRPFLYGLYYNLFGDGLGVTKTQPGAWSGLPLPTEGEDLGDYSMRVSQFLSHNPLPFTTRIVDPLTFYPPLNEYGEGVIVESGWRSTTEVMKSLNIVPDSSGNSLSFRQIPEGHSYSDQEFPPGLPPSVRVDEVWDGNSVAIDIHGSPQTWLLETEGEHPYVWGFADPTGVEDPSNVGMSVAYPLYYIAPWIDTMVGIMTAWSLFAAPTPFTTQDPGPHVRPTVENKIEPFQPGKMYHFATGRKPGILEPPAAGANVLQFLNFLIESSERGGLPALVSGSGVGTRLPALTFQAAFEAATDRLKPATQTGEQIIAGTLRKAVGIIGRYDLPVKVSGWDYANSDTDKPKRSWATIKPVEARKDRRIIVSLAVDSTQDLIAKGTHAQFMVAANLWDEAKAMRFAGDDNPEETKDKIDADFARRAMRPLLAQSVILEDPELAAVFAEQMEGEGGGEPAGPGRNREGVPAGRGGGKRGGPTQRPRGRRGGTGASFGRT